MSAGVVKKMGSRKLIIFGAKVLARLAHFYFTRASDYEVCAFTVDQNYLRVDSFCGLPVVAFEEVTGRFPPSAYSMFIAVGYAKMNKVREAKYHAAKELGYSLASFISPQCSFLSDLPIGDNCMIMEDSTIQPFVEIGNDVIICSGGHVAHDAVIGDHCFLASRVLVLGATSVGRNSFLGANATLGSAITIAPETLVGAGAVILKDTLEKRVYLSPRAVLVDENSDTMIRWCTDDR